MHFACVTHMLYMRYAWVTHGDACITHDDAECVTHDDNACIMHDNVKYVTHVNDTQSFFFHNA